MVTASVFQWRKPGDFLERIAKGFFIRITRNIHDFRDLLIAGFQFPLGGFDLYPAKVFRRRIASRLHKASVEIASAESELFTKCLDREIFHGVLFYERLRFFNHLILVSLLPGKNGKWGLAVALDIHLKDFGTIDSRFATIVFLDKIK
jgi:hypothetical protein